LATTSGRRHGLDVETALPHVRVERSKGALPTVVLGRSDLPQALEKPRQEGMRALHATAPADFARSQPPLPCAAAPLEIPARASPTGSWEAADSCGVWMHAMQAEMQEQGRRGCTPLQKTWASLQVAHAMRSSYLPLLFEALPHDAEAERTCTSFSQMQRNIGWSQHGLPSGSWMWID